MSRERLARHPRYGRERIQKPAALAHREGLNTQTEHIMETKNVTRRDFIKIAGAAGAGSMLSAGQVLAQVAAEPAPAALPARTFGKTGVKVPMLALGGIFDIVANQLVLQREIGRASCRERV